MFFSKRGKSGNVAKDRLKLLLLAEHVECSPHTMQMLKNDMAQTAGKYLIFCKLHNKIRVFTCFDYIN